MGEAWRVSFHCKAIRGQGLRAYHPITILVHQIILLVETWTLTHGLLEIWEPYRTEPMPDEIQQSWPTIHHECAAKTREWPSTTTETTEARQHSIGFFENVETHRWPRRNVRAMADRACLERLQWMYIGMRGAHKAAEFVEEKGDGHCQDETTLVWQVPLL